jgi:hypothetical protein
MTFSSLSLAQKVRLWFIVGVEAFSAILIIVALSSLNYSQYLDVTVASGNTSGVVAWILISQVAVVTLGIITFVRFLHPKAPAVPPAPTSPGPAGGYAPYTQEPTNGWPDGRVGNTPETHRSRIHEDGA